MFGSGDNLEVWSWVCSGSVFGSYFCGKVRHHFMFLVFVSRRMAAMRGVLIDVRIAQFSASVSNIISLPQIVNVVCFKMLSFG